MNENENAFMPVRADKWERAAQSLRAVGITATDPDTVYAQLSFSSKGSYRSLLGSSYKCDLGEGQGWATAVQYLAPFHDAGIAGFNACAFASPGCSSTCIKSTGQMIYPTHGLARVRRTLRWFLFPERTAQAFDAEVLGHVGKSMAQGFRPAVRGNGTSDNAFWLSRYGVNRSLPARRYDYTKRPPTRSILEAHEAGWHMTFSLDERPESWARACTWQSHGVNVAVVVAGPHGTARRVSEEVVAKLVERGELWGRPVINGDLHDLRFLDPAVGGWVLLAAKGGLAKRDTTGFVVRFDPDTLNTLGD